VVNCNVANGRHSVNKDVNIDLRDNTKYFNILPVDIVTQDNFYFTSSNKIDNNIYNQFRNAAFVPQDHDRNHDQSNYDNIIGTKQKDIEIVQSWSH